MERIVKISGKPYIVNWSGRGYWYSLGLTSSFHPDYSQLSQEKAFNKLVDLMKRKLKNKG